MESHLEFPDTLTPGKTFSCRMTEKIQADCVPNHPAELKQRFPDEAFRGSYVIMHIICSPAGDVLSAISIFELRFDSPLDKSDGQ